VPVRARKSYSGNLNKVNIKQKLVGLKNKLGSCLLVGGAVAASAVSARAEGFDSATITGEFSTAATLAGTIVAAIAALSVGVAVYKKIKSFFSKA
jgi:hypothetical protein